MKQWKEVPRPYGAPELKRVFQRNWVIGFLIAVVIHLVVVGSYYVVGMFMEEELPMVMIRIVKYSDLGPPPSIVSSNVPPPIAVSVPDAKPSIGTPVAVPDAEVTPEQTFATQRELSEAPAPVLEPGAGGEPGEFQVQPDIVIDEDTPPADFVPVEKDPVVIREVKPKYPELALRAGLEGRVWVKIWVDKTGKPRQVVVLKSDAEIFNDEAIKAATQFRFTPAYMNQGPVAVWVSIPFKFTLKR